jgi:hypothetical protein
MRKNALIGVALFLACSATAWASSPMERQTLKGLTAIRVVVESLDREVERDVITVSQLQTDVELQLRQSAITVVDTSTEELIYVSVNALKRSGSNGYAYSIAVEFVQPITVARTGQHLLGSTWNAQPVIGVTPLAEASQDIRAAVRDSVHEFINAYLSVNPKR